jgi:hypothetical protein
MGTLLHLCQRQGPAQFWRGDDHQGNVLDTAADRVEHDAPASHERRAVLVKEPKGRRFKSEPRQPDDEGLADDRGG